MLFTSNENQPPKPHNRSLRGRRLFVVDIENVVGGAVLKPELARFAHDSVQRSVALAQDEQVIIGTSHVGVLATGLGWRGARIVMRSGPDGADHALLDVLRYERIAERFDEIVLVSGDGIFADSVAELASMGVVVTVLARRAACSRRLKLAASRTVLFEDSSIDLGGAA